MDEPKSFRERLSSLLDESGATHEQVSRWMSVHRVAVTGWLAGRSEPRGGSEAIEADIRLIAGRTATVSVVEPSTTAKQGGQK